MSTKTAKEIANIIKNEPFSVLIILSVFSLPAAFSIWKPHFPKEWSLKINFIIIILWIFAFYQLRKEIIIWRRKIILFHYLRINEHKRHSIEHLTKEWDAKDEFTKEVLNELLVHYPDVFRRTKVRNRGRNLPGITLTDEAREGLKK